MVEEFLKPGHHLRDLCVDLVNSSSKKNIIKKIYYLFQK